MDWVAVVKYVIRHIIKVKYYILLNYFFKYCIFIFYSIFRRYDNQSYPTRYNDSGNGEI